MTHHHLKAEHGRLTCRLCGGAGEGLTTSCPGVRMTPEQIEQTTHSGLDYIEGRGWVWFRQRLMFNRERWGAELAAQL